MVDVFIRVKLFIFEKLSTEFFNVFGLASIFHFGKDKALHFIFLFEIRIRVGVPIRDLMIEKLWWEFGMVEGLLGSGKAMILVHLVTHLLS